MGQRVPLLGIASPNSNFTGTVPPTIDILSSLLDTSRLYTHTLSKHNTQTCNFNSPSNSNNSNTIQTKTNHNAKNHPPPHPPRPRLPQPQPSKPFPPRPSPHLTRRIPMSRTQQIFPLHLKTHTPNCLSSTTNHLHNTSIIP